MKLLYLHGLASGGQSATARLLQKLLPDVEVIAPDIPINPYEALAMLGELGKNLDASDVIVGTSMGAFYAQMMHGWKRILVNPSFHTSASILRPNFGKTMPFFLPRRDGVQTYHIDEELCAAVEDVESHQFDVGYGIQGSLEEDASLVKAFFGLKDTTVNCRDEYLEHYTQIEFFDGAHRLDPDTMTNIIVPEIKKLV